MKKIAILGSTGSIGTQALDIIEQNPDKFQVVALTCGSNAEKLSEQIAKHKPDLAVTANEKDALELKKKHPETEFLYGPEGLSAAAANSDCNLVLNALMGMRGLVPTYDAIRAGKDIAIANKETLVAGGELVMATATKSGVRLLPVDSEHSAIFQSLQGNDHKNINRLLLTASGGPFRGYSLEQLKSVTLEQALKHPKWTMGSKITIDSATLMNKGLEVIEARWLFNLPAERIQVVVHPQSIIHSMVEYVDHSIIAQLGVPDMRIPISYAFTYPDRIDNDMESVNFFEMDSLSFEKPDFNTFKCLGFAYDVLKAGGSYPVVLNAANEVLVQLFLEGRIRFLDIQNTIKRVLDEHHPTYHLDLEEILAIDESVRGGLRL